MPKFDTLSLTEAQMKSTSGKRAQILREYTAFIERVPVGQAGRLQPGPNESVSAVRRRLGAAAKASGKTLTIKRSDGQVFFWVEGDAPRRRGRRPKNRS